jgi:uncharacterized protein (TIGR02147 family)
MTIFRYQDYKKFLIDQIEQNSSIYGYKTKLAEAAGCQPSFLSQVIGSHVHLTPEHAVAIAKFWKLNQKERDFFVQLVGLARAGTRELQDYLRSKLEEMRKDQEHLGKRFAQKQIPLEDSAATIYYSSWHYSAIHILLTIPAFRETKSIAKRLSLQEPFIEQALGVLSQLGLVQKSSKGNWTTTEKSVHLPQESVLNSINNGNWRQRAMEDSIQRRGESVHYTGVYSMSRTDFQQLKDLTLELIDRSRQLVISSSEEELACFTCDIFKV